MNYPSPFVFRRPAHTFFIPSETARRRAADMLTTLARRLIPGRPRSALPEKKIYGEFVAVERLAQIREGGEQPLRFVGKLSKTRCGTTAGEFQDVR